MSATASEFHWLLQVSLEARGYTAGVKFQLWAVLIHVMLNWHVLSGSCTSIHKRMSLVFGRVYSCAARAGDNFRHV